MWVPPTYRDDMDEDGRTLVVRPRRQDRAATLADGPNTNPPVRCPNPNCRRKTSADMLTRIPAGLDVQDIGWCCDGCRRRVFRAGVSRAEFARALGAPADVVERLRARDERDRRRRSDDD